MPSSEPPASEIEALRAAYCPPLDDALFYAIASEYQLPRDRDALVDVLESLKEGALEQENAEFDPSGTGAAAAQLRDTTDTSRSGPDDTLSNGVTSMTTGLSDLRLRDEDGLDHDLNDSSIEGKTTWLQNMFPDIPKQELVGVLESHSGLLENAMDELLNLAFLRQDSEHDQEQETPVLKGIDGFAEGLQPKRKGRKRRQARTTDSSRASSTSPFVSDTEATLANVWSTMSEDVDFICSRTALQPQAVRSIYHENGARLSTTIRSLAVKEGAVYESLDELDPVVELQIAEFQGQFEHVPRAQVYGLLMLARAIPSAAQELLEAMTAVPKTDASKDLHDAALYAPLDLEKDSPSTPSLTPGQATGFKTAPRTTAASYRMAANQSFGQASTAYKRSRSDRLHGGVAAYYAEVGHEQARIAKEAQAAEADSLVARQSSSTSLDLHGVTVQDAVRIASVKTHGWWEGLGDAKYAAGGGGPAKSGFRIVTGVGSHSKNHAPRIGPAVSKMLIREGWKIEVGHGELVVTGRRRR